MTETDPTTEPELTTEEYIAQLRELEQQFPPPTWAEVMPDGTRESVQATPERLQQITCELIAVGQGATAPFAAPPGHTVADCSTAAFWSRALGRGLRDPW